jgi:hypothetical protein
VLLGLEELERQQADLEKRRASEAARLVYIFFVHCGSRVIIVGNAGCCLLVVREKIQCFDLNVFGGGVSALICLR